MRAAKAASVRRQARGVRRRFALSAAAVSCDALATTVPSAPTEESAVASAPCSAVVVMATGVARPKTKPRLEARMPE
jgi:hypothetical protein